MSKAARFPAIKPSQTPSPNEYTLSPVYKYKYKTSANWKIGTSQRKPLALNEQYTYYNHRYNPQNDLSTLPKKWATPIGGSIGLTPRIKYNFTEHTPGPGRYEPNYKITKPKTPSYYVGEKIDNGSPLKLVTGTNKNVGPGQYEVYKADKTVSKWKNLPMYSVGKDKRREMKNPKWTKNETYYLYSSMGDQIMTKKRTEGRPKEGKSTRTIEQKRGVFKSMMERQHIPIRIPMLDF